MKKRYDIIRCPVCGAEYLPGEIYLPNEFLGQPKYIEKAYSDGHILDYVGNQPNSMNLVEHYKCDRCNSNFKVVARVSFNTVEEDYNFTHDYSTKLTKETLFLKEEDEN